MSYIDGFIIHAPTGKKDAYLALAAKMASMFKEWGATRVVECWSNDVSDGRSPTSSAR